ncbi:MAG: hypothetical protein P8N02_01585 [Actinomycetota bacterium]|jgi:hypothetical protein|nr:hypothetical protein [Actinomycetota bacterium]
MSSELTNDDLDDFEVELAQVEQTLRLLADDQVDPAQVLEWVDRSAGVTDAVDASEGTAENEADDQPLAPVVELPIRFVTDDQ